jgi:ABC-2 type transport system ATP-binding protein
MLDVQNVSKWWGDFLAVDRVTFEVGAGEVVGFLGPNGAGKSTTMKIITGFVPPTSGIVLVDGHDVFTDSLAARRAIGYLPENTPIYPDMRVLEYLDFRAKLKGVARRERRASIERVMERCAVADMARRLVGQLSKGYRQRVGLADALLGNPKLLVLDEPTAGMDPNQVREVRKLVKELGRDHTILLSTHILPEVEATCSRVVIISGGRLVAQDEVKALQARAAAKGGAVEVEVQTPGDGFEAALREIPGVKWVERVSGASGARAVFRCEADGEGDLREKVARAALERGLVLLELRPVGSSLEDIFVRFTAGARAEEPAAQAAEAS